MQQYSNHEFFQRSLLSTNRCSNILIMSLLQNSLLTTYTKTVIFVHTLNYHDALSQEFNRTPLAETLHKNKDGGKANQKLTQMVRLTIAERVLLISRNVYRWQNWESCRDKGFQPGCYRICRMKQIVYLLHKWPHYWICKINNIVWLYPILLQRSGTQRHKLLFHLPTFIFLIPTLWTVKCTENVKVLDYHTR